MASPESAIEARVSRPNPPPLRIHHLMACGAVVALLFVIWRSQLRPESWKLVEAAEPSMLLLFTANQIIQAAALTLAGFSVYWHWKGCAALEQPGQWLPITMTIYTFESVAGPLIGPIVRHSPWGKNILLWDGADMISGVIYLLAFCMYWIVPILLFGWLAWRVADTVPWRMLFALKASDAAFGLVPVVRLITFRYFQSLGWSFEATSLLLATMACAGMMACAGWAAADDYRRGIRRTWTHWAGLGLFFALDAVSGLLWGMRFLGLR